LSFSAAMRYTFFNYLILISFTIISPFRPRVVSISLLQAVICTRQLNRI